MSNNDEQEGTLYRVDTVPPPEGESDAYNAPTRVGPIPAHVVAEMMIGAERKVAALNEKSAARARATAEGRPQAAVSESVPETSPRIEPPEGSTSPTVRPLARTSSPSAAHTRDDDRTGSARAATLVGSDELMSSVVGEQTSSGVLASTPPPSNGSAFSPVFNAFKVKRDRSDFIVIGMIIVVAAIAMYLLRN